MMAIASREITQQPRVKLSKADKVWLFTQVLEGCRFHHNAATNTWTPDNPFSDTRHHVSYTVSGRDVITRCDCTAGSHGAECWAAAALKRIGVPSIHAAQQITPSAAFEKRLRAAGILRAEGIW